MELLSPGTDRLGSVLVSPFGFAPYIRDYDVVIQSYEHEEFKAGRYRYRFTYCPVVTAQTLLAPEIWDESWNDPVTERPVSAGRPTAYVWAGANTLASLCYVEGSDRGLEWTERPERTMHHVTIRMHEETFTPKTWEDIVYESLQLDIVFHDLIITQVADAGWVSN